jgi:hypothetical protein
MLKIHYGQTNSFLFLQKNCIFSLQHRSIKIYKPIRNPESRKKHIEYE